MKSFFIGLLTGIVTVTICLVFYFPDGYFTAYIKGDPNKVHRKLIMKEAVHKFSYEEENNVYIVEDGFELLKIRLSEDRQITKITCFNQECRGFEAEINSSAKLHDFTSVDSFLND